MSTEELIDGLIDGLSELKVSEPDPTDYKKLYEEEQIKVVEGIAKITELSDHIKYLKSVEKEVVVEQPVSNIKRFTECYDEMYEICRDNNWGDPSAPGRMKEIHLANTLHHTISTTLSGADGYDEEGECEYKSTINKKIQATYNGISVQQTWEEQIKYLKEQKICKYKNHYFARYDGSKICEVYKMKCEKVYDGLIPYLKKKFDKKSKGKDPRLGHTLNTKYIIDNSTKIL